MTVATLNDVLVPAIKNKTAVAGLVVLGWEDARAFVEAAEELKVPIILQAGPGCRRYMPVAVLGKMFRFLAEQASTPIVCHIDHALTVEECIAGIEAGFSSVMIDGSNLPLQANIDLTSNVVEVARRAGVSVEGEVGVVGYNLGAQSVGTLPQDAEIFDQATNVDALAISIGNTHLNTNRSSRINFEMLAEIESVTRAPLVLHGGSGITTLMRQKLARETRVKKLNIGTELRMAFGLALRHSINGQPDEFDRLSLLGPTIPELRTAAKRIISELAFPDRKTFFGVLEA
jgi:fructose-bisphosphate aldolase, class II